MRMNEPTDTQPTKTTLYTRTEIEDLIGQGPLDEATWKHLRRYGGLSRISIYIFRGAEDHFPVWELKQPISYIQSAVRLFHESPAYKGGARKRIGPERLTNHELNPLSLFLNRMIRDGDWDGFGSPRLIVCYSPRLNEIFKNVAESFYRPITTLLRNHLKAVHDCERLAYFKLIDLACASPDWGVALQPPLTTEDPGCDIRPVRQFAIYPAAKDPSKPILPLSWDGLTLSDIQGGHTNLTWTAYPPDWVRSYVADQRFRIDAANNAKRLTKEHRDRYLSPKRRPGRPKLSEMSPIERVQYRAMRHQKVEPSELAQARQQRLKEFAVRWWNDPELQKRIPATAIPKTVLRALQDGAPGWEDVAAQNEAGGVAQEPTPTPTPESTPTGSTQNEDNLNTPAEPAVSLFNAPGGRLH